MTDLIVALALLGIDWALLAGASYLLATRPETAWVHRGGFVQAVSLSSTCLMALGLMLLIRFMAGAGWTGSVATVAGIVAVLVGAWLLKRHLRRTGGGDVLPGGPAPAV
jgi:hypothetical protein